MKKIFCILSILMIIFPVFADNGNSSVAEPVDPDAVVDRYHASVGYVKGAYNSAINTVNTVNNAKQDKLNSGGNNSNVVYTNNTSEAPVVTNVSASDGTVTVTKGEIKIPFGSPTSPTAHTVIWLQ